MAACEPSSLLLQLESAKLQLNLQAASRMERSERLLSSYEFLFAEGFMPCYITGSELGDEKLFAEEDRKTAKAAIQEVQKLTRLLCEACKLLKHHECDAMPTELRKWAEAHAKVDAKSKL